jgi:hypothetical protein
MTISTAGQAMIWSSEVPAMTSCWAAPGTMFSMAIMARDQDQVQAATRVTAAVRVRAVMPATAVVLAAAKAIRARARAQDRAAMTTTAVARPAASTPRLTITSMAARATI